MAFLGIKISQKIGKLLYDINVPGKREGTPELHITMLHFGDNWPISEITKSLEATYNVISHTKPFTVKTEEIICFPQKEGASAIVALIKSPKLKELREKLVKEFDKKKIDFSKTFKDYKPHITLSYSDKEISDFDFNKIEFEIDEIVLWCGDHGEDRIVVTFPLKGSERQKQSILLQKTDLFYKLANNPTQNYLKSSRK